MMSQLNLKMFSIRIATIRLAALALIAALPLLCMAAKEFTMPQAQPAKTYPAHDDHPAERVAVAVDPYDLADKAKIFSIQYNEIGFVPIFVVVTNDGDQPVELAGMKAQLVTANRAKISPAIDDDIARRLTRPSASTNRYPVPFPTKKVKGGLSKQAIEEIQNAQFVAKAVEPHSSQSGFLFFDVTGISVPLAGAHFYLTGVRDAKGNELMYFEVALEKYLSAPAKSD
ncbi:MAG TPA: hypothetical protein VHS34_17675 [Terriglobales bacterium]|jgi:hypothetical protein|nr:hypothetical protein [Terriglobales bacterium]